MDLTQAHVAKSLQFFGIAHQCPNVPVRTRALSICTGMCTTAEETFDVHREAIMLEQGRGTMVPSRFNDASRHPWPQ
jgi:hypothetical protein